MSVHPVNRESVVRSRYTVQVSPWSVERYILRLPFTPAYTTHAASPFVAQRNPNTGSGKSSAISAEAHMVNSPDTSTLAFWLSAYLRVG